MNGMQVLDRRKKLKGKYEDDGRKDALTVAKRYISNGGKGLTENEAAELRTGLENTKRYLKYTGADSDLADELSKVLKDMEYIDVGIYGKLKSISSSPGLKLYVPKA